MGREPADYDIATDARPEQVEQLFEKTIPVGRQFGVMLVVQGGQQFQVATYRAESGYADGRRPDRIEFSDARADALRRDFTVNGLFYDPARDQVYDWVGGRADLEKRVIRTIGPPSNRFAEDHLRLLRAARLAAQLEFEIESETFASVQNNAGLIRRISNERVRDELVRLFRPPHAARGLDLLRDSALLAWVLPEVQATVHCEQSPPYHPEGSVYNHLRLMLQQLPPEANPLLPWAVLLHDIGKPSTVTRDPDTGTLHFYHHEDVGEQMAREILTRLRFPGKQVEDIAFMVRHHMQFKDAPQMRRATLRRLLLRPTFGVELELHRLDCLGSHGDLSIHHFLEAQSRELSTKPDGIPPLLNGNDLIAMGMEPGPQLGRMLHDLADLQLQEEVTTREAALAWARTRLPPALADRQPDRRQSDP